MDQHGHRSGAASTGHMGVQHGSAPNWLMKRLGQWLLGVLVAAPIIFLMVLFGLLIFAGIYFIWMFD